MQSFNWERVRKTLDWRVEEKDIDPDNDEQRRAMFARLAEEGQLHSQRQPRGIAVARNLPKMGGKPTPEEDYKALEQEAAGKRKQILDQLLLDRFGIAAMESQRQQLETEIKLITAQFNKEFNTGFSTAGWDYNDWEKRRNAAFGSTCDELRRLNEKIFGETEAVNEQARKQLELDKPGDIPFRKAAKFDSTRNLAIQEGVGALSRIVDLDIPADRPAVFVKGGRGRAHYNTPAGNQQVGMTAGSGMLVVVHELGHWLEDVVPGLHEEAVKFYERRTADDNLVTMNAALGGGRQGYRSSEKTRPDKFVDPYIGKEYVSHKRTADRYATEVISMGLELMYRDPVGFAEKDPDMFDFIYSRTRRRR